MRTSSGLMMAILLSFLLLFSCQSGSGVTSDAVLNVNAELSPSSKGPKPTEAVGTIATRFELGLGLSPADFQPITSDLFETLQQRSGIGLADIARARVTVRPPQGEPVNSELSRADISGGWVFIFRNLPVGQNEVSLDILNTDGQALFSQTQRVLVEANLITPVQFVLDLDNPSSTCPDENCTGSIQVSVQARTQCFGVPRLPTLGKAGESLLFALDSLQGNVSEFAIDFGDGSPVQTLSSLPVRHTYASAGRYPVRLILDGPACKSPFEITGYLTVQK
jgi:hypothetical protein